MIQLTDELIRTAFAKTGFDEKYFPVYEGKVKQACNELQEDVPDDDETTEQESNVFSSIRRANDYIAYYVEEIEKGHGDTWAASIAENRGIEDEFYTVEEAYNSIENEDEREKELDIYINSLSEDPIFRERYKSLFHDFDLHPQEKASEYCEIFHRCINAGKSTICSHAFANEANNYFDERGTHYNEHFVDIHAEAVEQAIEHGMDDDQAYSFGDSCSEACEQGFLLMANNYLKNYHEDRQKAFYLYLYGKDYLHRHNREVPECELNDLRRELYK